MSTITAWLLTGISLVAIGATMVATVSSSRLTAAQASLRYVRTELAGARAELDRMSADRFATMKALETERERAVEAERQSADLREQIARDAGTARDGPTAPVLSDVLRRLGRRAP
jgi:peptidoglycan hydrolase CwlO-like protein